MCEFVCVCVCVCNSVSCVNVLFISWEQVMHSCSVGIYSVDVVMSAHSRS